ncbi:hypothetical protein ACWGJP_14745 [Microbacterium sp. NPDC055903]
MNSTPARPPSAGRQVLIVLVCVVIVVPLAIGAWIGLILLAERLELDLTANEVFAWMLAAVVAFLLWPLTLAATRRLFWANRLRKPGDAVPVMGTPLPSVPRIEVTIGDRLTRIAVFVLGALGLLVISGSQEITAVLTDGLGSVSSGSRSAWLALQLAVFLLLFALLFPVLWATDRMLKRVPRDDPRRRALEIRQDWYLAAVTAWVACLVLGYLFAYLILTRL